MTDPSEISVQAHRLVNEFGVDASDYVLGQITEAVRNNNDEQVQQLDRLLRSVEKMLG